MHGLRPSDVERVHATPPYVTRVAAKLPPETAPPNFYAETRHAFQRWHESIAADAAEFATKLSPDTSRNFVYAAHVSTQYLLAAGLPAGDFAAILDNNQDKIGKRLYGHGLRVKAPDAIRDVDRPVVVLRTGVYDDEIAAQLTKINPAVTLLRSANRTGGAPRGRQHHGHHDHRAGGPPRRLRGSEHPLPPAGQAPTSTLAFHARGPWDPKRPVG